MADPRPLDTSTLGPVHIGVETPRQRAVAAVMALRGCSGREPCVGNCTCQQLVAVVVQHLHPLG